jgi:hypothetical protein
MKHLLSSLALAGVLAAVPQHSARAQATDSTKKVVATKKAAAAEKKEGKEAHPRLVAAMKKLEASKKDLEAAPNDFGGHKAEAIKSIDEAMKHLRLALAADKK